jgi:hypothetical protein
LGKEKDDVHLLHGNRGSKLVDLERKKSLLCYACTCALNNNSKTREAWDAASKTSTTAKGVSSTLSRIRSLQTQGDDTDIY